MTEPIWGEPVSGLQLGIRGIRDQQQYIRGMTIHFGLVVRNTSKEPIRIEYYLSKTERWTTPMVMTAAGDRVQLSSMAFRGGHQSIVEVLEPEAMVAIQVKGVLVLGESETTSKFWPKFPDPQPGEYKLQGGFFFAQADSNDEPLGKNFRMGSGSVNIHIDESATDRDIESSTIKKEMP